MIEGGRGGETGFNFRVPLPFFRAIMEGRYGVSTNRSLLNVLLFVPLGILMPQTVYASSRLRVGWWQAVAAGFSTSLTIETLQLFLHRGVFELDDLVKNVMGTAIGWLIWKGLSARLHKRKLRREP